MRRFIIVSLVGLGLCLGGSTMAQAAVVKKVTTKTIVEKQVITEHVAAPHPAYLARVHWNHDFYRLHR